MKKTKIVVLLLAASLFLSAVLFFLSEKEVYPKLLSARDTDGTEAGDIISGMENGYEMVILKANPFGYLEAGGWENAGLLKNATALVEWKTFEGLGAGSIYIGYSFGENYTELGPFNESSNNTITEVGIPASPFTDISKLKVRFRGEDMDFGPDAIAEVRMRLKVIRYGV
jgi:hypothetical protein